MLPIPDGIHVHTVEGFGMSTIPTTSRGLFLSQYLIKGAYNAAFDGSQMTQQQLATVLGNGTRFLDLEICCVGGIPLLANSTDGKTIPADDTSFYFNDALNFLTTTAFSTVPNNGDPLFLHLRFYLTDPNTSRQTFYNTCATLLTEQLGGLLYTGTVSASTPLSELMGKVILLVDASLVTDYKNYCNSGDCTMLKGLINAQTASSSWVSMGYDNVSGLQPIPNPDDGSIMMPQNMYPMLQLVTPPISTLPTPPKTNPSPCDLFYYVNQCGCQTVLMNYYLKDTGAGELAFYESIFKNHSAAIVPMGYAMNFIQKSYKGQGAHFVSNVFKCSSIRKS